MPETNDTESINVARERVRHEMAQAQMQQGIASQQAMVEQAMAANVMSAMALMENKMDAEMQAYDNIQDMKDSELDKLRDAKRERMKKLQQKRNEWRQNGHGEYHEVKGQKDFFRECKFSERVLVHFFRSATHRCNIIDRHFSELAQKHLETKFIKIDAEKSPYLVEKLHIWMLPSIVVVKNGKTIFLIILFHIPVAGTTTQPSPLVI